MKQVTMLSLLLMVGLYSAAQQNDLSRADSIEKNFKVRKSILVLFEKLDTANVTGKKSVLSRAYYFDEKQRKISSVREYDNNMNPKKGTQVIYTYIENQLAKVMVILPDSECMNCAGEYYYSNDTLFAKKETGYKNPNPESFITQAHYFQSKLPRYLPWGYFQNEVLLNGKMKKIRDGY